MQATSWLALLKRMPQSQHDNLSLVTTTGTEVAVQQVIRLDRDFMVVRGRLTGTTDTGVIIVLPYDQISYLNFIKKMPVEEVSELFKDFQAPPPAQAALQYVPVAPGQPAPVDDFKPISFSVQPAESKQPAETKEQSGQPEAPGRPGSKSGQPVSKTMMLARLRARLAAESGRGPASEG